MSQDPYRDWSPADRSDAAREGDRKGVEQYDRDSESSERAWESWITGGEFQDPEPDNRFS